MESKRGRPSKVQPVQYTSSFNCANTNQPKTHIKVFQKEEKNHNKNAETPKPVRCHSLEHANVLHETLELLQEGLIQAPTDKLKTLRNYLLKCRSGTKSRWKEGNPSKMLRWYTIRSLMESLWNVTEMEIAEMMISETKASDTISEFICKNFSKYEEGLTRRLRLQKLSAADGLSIVHSVGISLVQYKTLYRELKRRHIDIFCDQSKVSTLQAETFQRLALHIKATFLPTQMGVSLSQIGFRTSESLAQLHEYSTQRCHFRTKN